MAYKLWRLGELEYYPTLADIEMWMNEVCLSEL